MRRGASGRENLQIRFGERSLGLAWSWSAEIVALPLGRDCGRGGKSKRAAPREFRMVSGRMRRSFQAFGMVVERAGKACRAYRRQNRYTVSLHTLLMFRDNRCIYGPHSTKGHAKKQAEMPFVNDTGRKADGKAGGMETFYESVLAALRAARDQGGFASVLAAQCGVQTATIPLRLTGERSLSAREAGTVFDALKVQVSRLTEQKVCWGFGRAYTYRLE